MVNAVLDHRIVRFGGQGNGGEKWKGHECENTAKTAQMFAEDRGHRGREQKTIRIRIFSRRSTERRMFCIQDHKAQQPFSLTHGNKWKEEARGDSMTRVCTIKMTLTNV